MSKMDISSKLRDYSRQNLQFFIDFLYENGDDATLHGVKLLADKEKFVNGCVINNAVHLYIFHLKEGVAEKSSALPVIKAAIARVKESGLKTWGKFGALRALAILKKHELLSILTDDELQTLKTATDYTDFYDKEKGVLRGAPSNYYQVAMACAGLRALLGWEDDTYFEILQDKLISVMQSYSQNGWMDENPPYGRYDRYSMIISAELVDTLDMIGKPIPPFALESLKRAADLVLACANGRGDGVNYGRSLSVHGDCAFMEILSTAMKHGLVARENYPLALSFIDKIWEKTMTFWFDERYNGINLWFDGRTTNNYRQSHRLLEVNLDMINHFLTTAANFDAVDTDLCFEKNLENPHGFGNPYRVIFDDSDGKKRYLYCFVEDGHLIMLPLIHPSSYAEVSAYLPLPSINGLIEGSPETEMPLLVPEFVVGGDKFLPFCNYKSISDKSECKKTIISASGKLAKLVYVDGKRQIPEESTFNFNTTYTFEENSITLLYETDLLDATATVQFMTRDGSPVKISVHGYESFAEKCVTGDPKYFTPHGGSDKLYEWKINSNTVKIVINDFTKPHKN